VALLEHKISTSLRVFLQLPLSFTSLGFIPLSEGQVISDLEMCSFPMGIGGSGAGMARFDSSHHAKVRA
jgi:hypothetical protein